VVADVLCVRCGNPADKLYDGTVEMTMLARGMLPWRPEAVKLQLRSYLVSAKLPAVPATFGHVQQAAPPVVGGWGMLGNDKAGDCVIVGAAHETMTWAWATGKTIPSFTSVNVLKQYRALTGGADAGLDPISTAKWRVSNGLADAHGGVHKVKAFGAVNSLADVELAVYLFGVCGLGLSLPNSAEQQFMDGRPWDDVTGEPQDGHYVPCVGKNSAGNLVVVTWAKNQAMTSAYFDKYCVGAICYFSPEYLLATGKSPELFDEAQLDADLAAMQA
jgi:hypothetical protein